MVILCHYVESQDPGTASPPAAAGTASHAQSHGIHAHAASRCFILNHVVLPVTAKLSLNVVVCHGAKLSVHVFSGYARARHAFMWFPRS